ncbi:MAG: hypothetical protein JJ957_01360 [Pseudomonadales bacterium]|nr:hypothetical protein [Pseudomonadales bacterium]MBO6594458.1 hypothetical protein [Pseudomonadales bacterium]MBO6821981.1 hypothetical protein [Pseudomonadales bacterium]
MNRRHFLLGGLTLALGVGLGSSLRIGSITGGDLERQLLEMVRPDGTELILMFPQFQNYEDTVAELTARGVVVDHSLNMKALNSARASDPVLEFADWQYLETELLVFLAAYQLAGKQLNITSSRSGLSFDRFEVSDGLDAQGEPIATYKIQSGSDYEALNACIQMCDHNDACNNFTLAKQNHHIETKRNICWLVGDEVNVVENRFYFSGRKIR